MSNNLCDTEIYNLKKSTKIGVYTTYLNPIP